MTCNSERPWGRGLGGREELKELVLIVDRGVEGKDSGEESALFGFLDR